MHLYEISAAYQMLIEIQEDDEFAQALADIIDNFDDKVESVAKVIRSLEAEADAYDVEAKRLSNAKQARQNRADGLKKYLLSEMQAIGCDKVQGKVLSVAVQKSTPACTIQDEVLIPIEFKEIVEVTNIDRRGIIEYWKQTGEQTAGAYVIQGSHVRIRP